MPTLSLSPDGFQTSMGGPGQMHHSVPHVRPVAANPFFDAIRQNLELAHGAGSSGEPIVLRLPRRVRRRVGDLPFEWLREIARRSGRARETSSSEEDDDDDDDEEMGDEEQRRSARQRKSKSKQATRKIGSMALHEEHGRAQHHSHPTKRGPPMKTRATEPRSTTPRSSESPSPELSPRTPRPAPHRSSRFRKAASSARAKPCSGAPHSSKAKLAAILASSASRSHSSSDSEMSSADAAGESQESSGSASAEGSGSSSQSPSSAEDLTRALELQFYKIELGEQRRLMGVMEHHSKESGTQASAGGMSVSSAGVIASASRSGRSQWERGNSHDQDDLSNEQFPFSITAGLEKGNKNRYRNIWPFEHARVRLCKSRPDDDDYMNASYVQPLGTTKRYIATQGPLPATFADFWTLCWEQNVHVVVMLTREIESNTVKCGKYWDDGEYGPLRLKLLATDDTPEQEHRRKESEMNAGFFAAHVTPPHTSKGKGKGGRAGKERGRANEHPSTVRRVFQLKHTGYPRAPPRIITQLQYLDWPDFNVPSDPRGVLELIHEVEEAVARSRAAGDKDWGEGPLKPGPWPAPFAVPTPSSPKGASGVGHTTLDGVSEEGNEVDPSTGIARHAQGNPPVLLHCSAGVGRTGGFIAVDAVLDGLRRDMRKRREETEAGAAAGGSASIGTSGSARTADSRSRSSPSGTSSRGEPMEVDSSPSPPSGVRAAAASSVPALTVPVPVGQSEVHVRVAGFDAVAMEVDGKQGQGQAGPPARRERPEREFESATGSAAIIATPGQKQLPRTVLPASPQLLDEVRRAAMSRWPSTSSASTAAGQSQGAQNKDWESNSSDSCPARSGVDSGSGSGATTGTSASTMRSHSSLSPSSSQAGSSTSLSATMTSQAANMTLQSPAKKAASGSGMPLVGTGAEFSLSPTSPLGERSGEESVDTSRLDTWRSEVGTSRTPPREEDSRSSKSPEVQVGGLPHGDLTPDQDPYFQRAPFDYAQPRRLHRDLSPPLLSSYDEPIRRVIEDMREQRMSLCQSLRQYVFVHRAVIEGALMIIDEERERGRDRRRREDGRMDDVLLEGLHAAMDVVSPARRRETDNVGVQKAALAGGPTFPGHGQSLGPAFMMKGKEASRKRSLSDLMREARPIEDHHAVASSSTISPGGTKRGASPTELQKESKLGEVMLTKRPSVKRKPHTDSESSVEFDLPSGRR